jgi:hypothetical protein
MKGDYMATVSIINEVSNDAKGVIDCDLPYVARISIEGTAPFLFHRWSVDGVEAKSKAAKGSKAKKEDDLETFVYRNESGELCIPGEYLRMSMVHAAKYKQDPRSPRKSAMDIVKAGIASLDDLCTTGKKQWDFIDRRRVMIQRNGITRSRPGLLVGWRIESAFQILLPEYLSPQFLNDLCQSAGRLIGIGDFRPTFGRFQVTKFRHGSVR